MTAEVAIANASAIALAADSAVSIGDQKIYNSALKLFSLQGCSSGSHDLWQCRSA